MTIRKSMHGFYRYGAPHGGLRLRYKLKAGLQERHKSKRKIQEQMWTSRSPSWKRSRPRELKLLTQMHARKGVIFLLSGHAGGPPWWGILLHIMSGYRYDKAVTKNDTREVIWYHFTAVKWCHITSRFELPNQIDCNNLVRPIGLHVIF